MNQQEHADGDAAGVEGVGEEENVSIASSGGTKRAAGSIATDVNQLTVEVQDGEVCSASGSPLGEATNKKDTGKGTRASKIPARRTTRARSRAAPKVEK